MKKILLIVISILILVSKSQSQFSADNDGNYNISNFNGSLTYTYPISNTTIDGYPITVNVNYISNLPFVSLVNYFQNPENGQDVWEKMIKRHPAWIIGVNGFAVQVLTNKHRLFNSGYNSSATTYGMPDIEPTNEHFLTDANFNWVIEGYDFCNRLDNALNPNYQDNIKILKSDGGILDLKNAKFGLGLVDATFTGIYYENSINSLSYAIVEKDTTEYPPDLKSYFILGNNYERKPRLLKYYPGNGLEYVFRETVIAYGKREDSVRTLEYYSPDTTLRYITSSAPYTRHPKGTIFYLVSINSSLNNLTTFDYKTSDGESPLITRGRRTISSFANHKISFSNKDFKMQVFDKNYTFLIMRDYNNPSYNMVQESKELWEEQEMGYDWPGILFRQPKFNSITSELSTPYIRYKSETDEVLFNNYFITNIIDPENREIKFGYSLISKNYTDFMNSSNYYASTMSFYTPILDTIFTPSECIIFDYYHNNNNTVLYSDLADGKLDLDFNQVVKNCSIYDYKISNSEKVPNSLLYKNTYEFHDTTIIYESYRDSKIINHDYTTGIVDTTVYYFKEFNTQAPYYSANNVFLTLRLYYPILLKTEYMNGNKKITQTIETKTINQINSSINSNYYLYPTYEEVVLKENNVEKVLERKRYNYTFEQVLDFELLGNHTNHDIIDVLKSKWGWGLKENKVTKLSPLPSSPSDSVLMSEVTKYLNLKLIYNKYIERIDTVLDFPKSNYETLLNIHNGIQSNLTEYTLRLMHDTINIPPLYMLPLRTELRNKNNEVISGKINVYDTLSYLDAVPQCRRGALIADSVIGLNNKVLLSKKYHYKIGNYRNLLQSIENAFGISVYNYYEYDQIPGYRNTDLNGKIMKNNEEISLRKFFKKSSQYEAPIATSTVVRKFVPMGSGVILDSTRLTSVFERTDFGQISYSMNPNGWLYKNSYDNNGRALFNWHPYDFPDEANYESSSSEDCVPITTTMKNSVVTHLSSSSTTQNSIVLSRNSDSLFSPYDLGLGKDLSVDSIRVEGSDTLTYVTSTEKKLELIYQPSPYDQFHDGSVVTTAKLNLLENSINQSGISLKLSIPQLNYEKTIVLDSKGLVNIQNNCPETPYENKHPIIEYDLTPLIPELMNSTPGDSIKMVLEVTSLSGIITFPDLGYDYSPCIKVNSDFKKKLTMDYTFRYEYDDFTRQTSNYSKIDDKVINIYNPVTRKFPHSSNTDWQNSLSDYDGRYSKSISTYGAFNKLLKSELLIGRFSNPLRIDSVVGSYSGLKTKDQLGYIFEGFKDDLGRIKKTYQPTYTGHDSITYEYNYGQASDFNISEDYYGLCLKKTKIDPLQIKSEEYYDALGHLRRSIVDADTEKITTSYYYNDRGLLYEVVNEKWQSTFYNYDEFGRVIKKTHPDIGYELYSFDNLGNIRFKINQEQKLNNKLTFMEYDDLGRTTIVGEAKINGIGNFIGYNNDTIANVIDPNILHHNLGGYSYLTCNPTIWTSIYTGTYNPVPIVTTSTTTALNYVNYHSYDNDNISPKHLKDSIKNMFEDMTYPYIMHKANYYTQAFDTMATKEDFEDISKYPQFVRLAINYDELPQRNGNIWKNYPFQEIWTNLSPRAEISNLKGQKAAIAYRNASNQPFHYVTMTYDARGRVEALLRFTENLGFDAVYYKYNSMNQPIRITVADAVRQYSTWYSYDENGRVDSVYTRVGDPGTGLDNTMNNLLSSFKFPTPIDQPDHADIVYKYNKRGSVDTIIYKEMNVVKNMIYDPKGWLETIVAKSGGNILFSQILTRDPKGNITKQESNHDNQNALEQNYTYDRLNRIKQWITNPNTQSESYTYDKIGNRLSYVKSGITHNFTYQSGTNQLQNIVWGNETVTYNYNENGAIVSRTQTENSTLVDKEEYDYFANGMQSIFEKYNLKNEYANQTFRTNPMTIDHDKWTWAYNYSYSGAREQKRLLYSPHGDSLAKNQDSIYAHLWEYSLLGAGGEELALYKGKQRSDITVTANGRRVYMSLSRFYCGGELQIRADGKKELHITDNLGCVRMVLVEGETTHLKYNYTPFGEPMNSDSKTQRKGFMMATYDNESNLTMMGARMYDRFSGMFTSPDPLLDYFPTQSTYCYAMNNPLRMKDPSGLAPEGEKYDERLQELLIDWDKLAEEAFNNTLIINGIDGLTICHDSADELAQAAVECARANPGWGFSESDAGKAEGGGGTRTGEDGGNDENGNDRMLPPSITEPKDDDSNNNNDENKSRYSQRPDIDGKITLEEAQWWAVNGEEYCKENGGSMDLHVNIEKIDLSKVTSEDFDNKVDNEGIIKLESKHFADKEDAQVYGTITLVYKGNGQVKAFADRYDTEMHPWFTEPIRNIGTLALRSQLTFLSFCYGKYGKVSSYNIFIDGITNIKVVKSK